MHEFTVNPSSPGNRERLRRWINDLVGPHRITAVRLRPRRTDPQNSYFHGPVIDAFRSYVEEVTGHRTTFAKAKAFLKSRYCPHEDVVDPLTGEVIDSVPRSTADLSVGEFVEMLDAIHAWFVTDLGLLMPDPSEYRAGVTPSAVASSALVAAHG